MNIGLLAFAGVVLFVVGLLVWLRHDLRSGAAAEDDLAEARAAEKMRRRAEAAEAKAREKNQELR